jgi:hypothetical protein
MRACRSAAESEADLVLRIFYSVFCILSPVSLCRLNSRCMQHLRVTSHESRNTDPHFRAKNGYVFRKNSKIFEKFQKNSKNFQIFGWRLWSGIFGFSERCLLFRVTGHETRVTGRVTVTVVPLSGWLDNESVPWFISMSRCA